METYFSNQKANVISPTNHKKMCEVLVKSIEFEYMRVFESWCLKIQWFAQEKHLGWMVFVPDFETNPN